MTSPQLQRARSDPQVPQRNMFCYSNTGELAQVMATTCMRGLNWDDSHTPLEYTELLILKEQSCRDYCTYSAIKKNYLIQKKDHTLVRLTGKMASDTIKNVSEYTNHYQRTSREIILQNPLGHILKINKNLISENIFPRQSCAPKSPTHGWKGNPSQ